MHIVAISSLLLASTTSALPGLLHDESHYTQEVLDNIHHTPYCAYVCIFDETYQSRFAPECNKLEGMELGACYCRADAYQYIVDQCVERNCSRGQRKKVLSDFG